MEGPLGREPNMYTNYQTYSLTATKTQSKSEVSFDQNVRLVWVADDCLGPNQCLVGGLPRVLRNVTPPSVARGPHTLKTNRKYSPHACLNRYVLPLMRPTPSPRPHLTSQRLLTPLTHLILLRPWSPPHRHSTHLPKKRSINMYLSLNVWWTYVKSHLTCTGDASGDTAAKQDVTI